MTKQASEQDIIRVKRIQKMSDCARRLMGPRPPHETPVFRWNVAPEEVALLVRRKLVLCIATFDYGSIESLVSAYEQHAIDPSRIVVAVDLGHFPDGPYYALKSRGVLFKHTDAVEDLMTPSAARTRFERELTPVFRSTLHLAGIENPIPSRQLDYEPSPYSLSDAQLDDFITRVQSRRYESID